MGWVWEAKRCENVDLPLQLMGKVRLRMDLHVVE